MPWYSCQVYTVCWYNFIGYNLSRTFHYWCKRLQYMPWAFDSKSYYIVYTVRQTRRSLLSVFTVFFRYKGAKAGRCDTAVPEQVTWCSYVIHIHPLHKPAHQIRRAAPSSQRSTEVCLFTPSFSHVIFYYLLSISSSCLLVFLKSTLALFGYDSKRNLRR